MDLVDRYCEKQKIRIVATFGILVVQSTRFSHGYHLSTSDFSVSPSFMFDRSHCVYTHSRLFENRMTHREFFYGLLAERIPYEVNGDGIYIFPDYDSASTARQILIDLLYDEKFQFRDWSSLV